MLSLNKDVTFYAYAEKGEVWGTRIKVKAGSIVRPQMEDFAFLRKVKFNNKYAYVKREDVEELAIL